MILSDKSIMALCDGCAVTIGYDADNKKPIIVHPNRNTSMIAPFVSEQIRVNGRDEKIVSYGLTSYGYDIRLADEFKLFSRPNDGRVIDVKNFKEDDICEEIKADSIVIPPGGLLLGRSVEYFSIPRLILAECLGKSTWARVGAIVNVTPLEPEWEGHLVIEITNGTNLPLKMYANEGIAQLVFHVGDRPCGTSYANKGGKYQAQTGVTTSRM